MTAGAEFHQTRIAALATCHERREVTLRALEGLRKQRLPTGVSLEVHVVDDGSRDGTGEAVRTRFPDVSVYEGSGSLFWAGGMRFGWEHLREKDWDYLLVFNDDVSLRADAANRLLAVAEAMRDQDERRVAVAGAFMEPGTGRVAYGGVRRCSVWHPLKFEWMGLGSSFQDCDTLNMNLALISREAIEEIGFLSEVFVHRGADYDFGLRLRAAGGRVLVAPGFVGECARNDINSTSAAQNISFSERWRRLTSVKEQPPRERAHYYRAHAGVFWPILWCLPYLKVLVMSAVGVVRGRSW